MHAGVWKTPGTIGQLDDHNDDRNDNDDDDDGIPSFLVWVLLLERAPAGPDHNAVIIVINFIINITTIVIIIIISIMIGIFCKIEVI